MIQDCNSRTGEAIEAASGDACTRQRRRLSLAILWATVLVGVLAAAAPAWAHEFTLDAVMNAFVKIDPREAHLVIRVPLYAIKSAKFPVNGREIDVAAAEPAIQRALSLVGREITLEENGRPLRASAASGRLSLPSDRSFESYEAAVAHVAQPVGPDTVIYADQGYLDAELAYPIASPASRFTIRTAIAPELRDYLKLAVRYLAPGEDGRAMVITSRSGRVALNPTWYRAASAFVALGISHILTGVDHLLFLLCLVIPFRGFRQVLGVVSAFTVGHSVTLLGSAFGLAPEGAWFPPFVETMIAASIVYMAIENIVGSGLRRRWLIAGLFGLVHGFGFSYGLRESLQFAGRHLLVSLFSFNVGIEIGQILVLVVMLPALALVLGHVLVGRVGAIVLSAMVAHVGWHWMTDRADVLWKVEWPALDHAGLVTLARWTAAILLAGSAAGLIAKRLRERRGVSVLGADGSATLGAGLGGWINRARSRFPAGAARRRAGL